MSLTISQLIKKWILLRLSQGNHYVKTSDIETSLVNYSKEYWGILHTPSTWSRGWRDFRRLQEYKDIDIQNITRVKNNRSRQHTWMIETG